MVEKEHSVLVERREKLTIKGGVLKVHSFDDSKIILETKLGFMELSGEDIHIEELNLEEGDLSAKGRFDGLKYLEERSLKEKGKGILSKILK
ncbi:MAG TPA: sporulation protein YabP [Peptococcaceae bacterium]|nr:MAG: Sporulation protein YabP [Clostridia bacterium 41_269]HBT20676.1 sporulation protein YabP [Peptococcaceae bacterium]